MGVRRAVEMVMDAPTKNEGPIYTYGSLIHNAQVLSLLEEKGISILDQIPEQGQGTVLVRAHGVPPQAKSDLKKAGFNVVDATCPRVIKVQTIIRKHARQGYASIIIGDRDHPEVIGLIGHAGRNGYVVGSMEELEALPTFEKAIIVAQTTQNTRFFESVKHWAESTHPDYKIFETICDSTERRQAEVKRLSSEVDTIIVVGGRNSGNTQRLAEIAKASGKATYHIETEKDFDNLEINELSTSGLIGITAGASTPNWIIKRVYRALESLRYKKSKGWRHIFFIVQRALLLTNLYISIGAGCLCFACAGLLGIQPFQSYVIIAMFYIQAMHTLNHLTGRRSDRFNDPERAAFYNRHQVLLTALAIILGTACLWLAFRIGPIPFVVLLFMSLAGLSYNLVIIPKWVFNGRYRRLKDMPGSKTILIAFAWGVVTSLFPWLSHFGSLNTGTVFVFSWSVGLVFVRTAFFDILDMQGDRIVGKETIPILLGEKRTLRLLKAILVTLAVLLLISAVWIAVPSLVFPLAICPLFIAAVIAIYEKRVMIPGIRMEFLLESTFLLAGIVSAGWLMI